MTAWRKAARIMRTIYENIMAYSRTALRDAHSLSYNKIMRSGRIARRERGRPQRGVSHIMKHCPLILICDDDPNVHESIGLYLDSEGYEHISAYDGEQALKLVEERQPDLMILDLMMPRMSGIDVCRTIRLTKTLPIIMLTAKSEEIDRILGLELGADDYIVKPFSPREVLARIKAVLRRFSEKAPEDKSIIRFPHLEINLSNYQVKACEQVVPFTPKEVEILHMLALQASLS